MPDGRYSIENNKEKDMRNNSVTSIESIAEAQAKEMSLESVRIKEHNIYFVDFGDTYGYSCLVFKNNHHIHYANDYELHHTGKTREELKQIYIKKMNNRLFTEAEISAPLKNYGEYTRKSYFLHNYYGMQVDYISIFQLNPTDEFKKDFKKQTEHMTYNPVSFSYMYDPDFVAHHIELLAQLEKAKAETSGNYEYLKKAYLHEMYNHEYGINLQADYDVLRVFGKIQCHEESMDALETYFRELNFTNVQRRAYLDARTQYFRVSGCY